MDNSVRFCGHSSPTPDNSAAPRPASFESLRRTARRPRLRHRAATRWTLLAFAVSGLSAGFRDPIDAVAVRVAARFPHLTQSFSEVLPRWAPAFASQRFITGEPGWSGVIGGSAWRPPDEPLVYLLRSSSVGRLVRWDVFDGRMKWAGRIDAEVDDYDVVRQRYLEVIDDAPGILLLAPAADNAARWVCISVRPGENELHFAAKCEAMTWALSGAQGFSLRSWAARGGRAAWTEFRYDPETRTYRPERDEEPVGVAGSRGTEPALPPPRGSAAAIAAQPARPAMRLWSPSDGRSVLFPPSRPLNEVLDEVFRAQRSQ